MINVKVHTVCLPITNQEGLEECFANAAVACGNRRGPPAKQDMHYYNTHVQSFVATDRTEPSRRAKSSRC